MGESYNLYIFVDVQPILTALLPTRPSACFHLIFLKNNKKVRKLTLINPTPSSYELNSVNYAVQLPRRYFHNANIRKVSQRCNYQQSVVATL